MFYISKYFIKNYLQVLLIPKVYEQVKSAKKCKYKKKICKQEACHLNTYLSVIMVGYLIYNAIYAHIWNYFKHSNIS